MVSMESKRTSLNYQDGLLLLLTGGILVALYLGIALPGMFYALLIPTLLALFWRGQRDGAIAAVVLCVAAFPATFRWPEHQLSAFYAFMLVALLTLGVSIFRDARRQRKGALAGGLPREPGAELRDRSDSIVALQRVTREITSTLDLDRILRLVLDEALHFADADAGFIVLWDGEVELRTSRGYETEALANLADLVQYLERAPLFAAFMQAPETCYVADLSTVPANASLFPGAQSLLLTPVMYQEHLAAAVVVQSTRTDAFTPMVRDFVDGLAAQAAVAIGNARRYEEQLERGELMHQRAEQMRLLLEVARTMRSDRPLEETLLDMVYATQEAVGYELVMISVLEGEMVRRVAGAGIPLADLERMKQIRQPWAKISPFFQDRFRIGHCYYIPAQEQELWRNSGLDILSCDAESVKIVVEPGMWHPCDLLLVPLRSTGGDTLGYMSVDRPRNGRAPTQNSVEVLELFAAQIALTIENGNLVEDLHLRINTLSLFNELNQVITTKLNLSLVLNTVVQAVTNLLGYDYATTFLQDRESHRFVPLASSGYALELLGDASFGPDEGLVGQVVQSGMPLVLEDAEHEAHYAPAVLQVGASIMVPLMAEGRPVGVLVADRKRKGEFSTAEVATFTALADQVSVAVENARLFEEVKGLSEELERRVEKRTEELAEAMDSLRVQRDRNDLLYRIASELVASLDIDRVLNKALSLLSDAVGAQRGFVMLFDQDTGYLYNRASIGQERPVPPGGVRSSFNRDEGLIGWLLQNRKAVVVSDVRKDERWVPHEGDPTRSVLAVPIVNSNEDAVGAIFLHAFTENAFSEGDLRLLETAGVQVGNALNNAQLYRLIREQTERLGSMLRTRRIEAAKNQAILEGIADGVMVANANGRINLFNAAAGRILSVDRTLALGRLLDEMLGLYGSKAREWLELIQEWRDNPDSYKSGEFLAERLNLEERVVSVHLSPVFSQADEFLGVVSVFRDVTAEVEADRAKSDFVSTVSHELRTPMTSIKGYVDLLLMGSTGPLNDLQTQFLQVVKSNADRLTLLVNDLLDISRIETGKVVLQPQPLDMRPLIDQVILTITPKAGEKGLRMHSAIPEGLPKAYGDPARVIQILTNLVGNAYKYTPTDGDITVHAYVQNEMFHVAVIDTGIGISKENQQRLFERFFRVDDPLVEEISGTGLGLAISASLIKMHGGEITVESEAGVGSNFAFTLPLAEGEPTEDVGEPPISLLTEVPATILVVEDDMEVAGLLRILLESEGRRVIVAATGEDALTLARTQKVDMVSLDVRLPDMDGFDILQLLKRDPKTASIPVMMLSVVPDRERGLRLGAVDYLTKPLDEGLLIQVVDRILDKRSPVLVVDDDLETLLVLQQALRAQGLGVRTAEHGEIALNLAREVRPCLILLDLKLPGLDGYQILEQLKRDPRTVDIPVIVMTGAVDPGDGITQKIESMGALRFLTKPFSMEELAKEISAVVDRECVK